MNKLIADKYQVNFNNRVLDSTIVGKQIYKSMELNVDVIGSFLLSWRSPEEISDLLLPDLNSALTGTEDVIENGSETIVILIYQDKTVFYPDNKPSVSIPTLDLKEIVIGWRDFLLTPPLDGSRV